MDAAKIVKILDMVIRSIQAIDGIIDAARAGFAGEITEAEMNKRIEAFRKAIADADAAAFAKLRAKWRRT